MRLHKAGGDQHLVRDGLETGRARLRGSLPTAPQATLSLVSCVLLRKAARLGTEWSKPLTVVAP